MSEDLVDVRTLLASSKYARVELGRDGVLHVLAGPVTLHIDRTVCEDLTSTLARAMIALTRVAPKARGAKLRVVGDSTRARPDERRR